VVYLFLFLLARREKSMAREEKKKGRKKKEWTLLFHRRSDSRVIFPCTRKKDYQLVIVKKISLMCKRGKKKGKRSAHLGRVLRGRNEEALKQGVSLSRRICSRAPRGAEEKEPSFLARGEEKKSLSCVPERGGGEGELRAMSAFTASEKRKKKKRGEKLYFA